MQTSYYNEPLTNLVIDSEVVYSNSPVMKNHKVKKLLCRVLKFSWNSGAYDGEMILVVRKGSLRLVDFATIIRQLSIRQCLVIVFTHARSHWYLISSNMYAEPVLATVVQAMLVWLQLQLYNIENYRWHRWADGLILLYTSCSATAHHISVASFRQWCNAGLFTLHFTHHNV